MNNINKILEKYFEGETSLQEEEILHEYFRDGNISEEHKQYAPLFGYFRQERDKIAKIPAKKRKLPVYIWSGIAACIMIVLLVRFTTSTGHDDLSKSLVYIDGKKISDIETINSQALKSIENISDMDEDAINMQISVLDSFTQ